MRRISVIVWALALLAVAASVWATPTINSAVVKERVWNDCPISNLTVINSYPLLICIQDCNYPDPPGPCIGYANLHVWRLSSDGVNPALFSNADAFRVCATLTICGEGSGEAGLQISPWWSLDSDGRFNVRSTDGEIACFGGRLPFYSFTANYGLVYVKGVPIYLEMIYIPNGLSSSDPATIEYKLTYNSVTYTSGPLPFDEGNPLEDPPHGVWGMLTPANVGGHLQYFVGASAPDKCIQVEWCNICYEPLTIAVTPATWGSIKEMYR